MIGYSQQCIDQSDIDAVTAVLKSTHLTQGPVVQKFAHTISNYTSCKHTILVNSGTSALHVACLALGVGRGDIVWTTPISFVASSNCALYCGADIDFVDIESDFISMCPDAFEAKVQRALQSGQLPQAIVVVDFSGQPGHLQKIASIARNHDIKIIEDACHAFGGDYLGRKIGSCQYSDISVFSFHPVKSIACGEGGAVLTQCDQLATQCKKFASHGITKLNANDQKELVKPWYYEQQTLGYNYRMSDIHAALGLSQLQRIDEFIQARHQAAAYYRQLFAGSSVECLAVNSDAQSANHLFPILLPESEQKVELDAKQRIADEIRMQVMAALKDKGFATQVHYMPITSQPYYRELGFETERYPNALNFYQRCLSIPLFPGIKQSQQEEIAATIISSVGAQQ